MAVLPTLLKVGASLLTAALTEKFLINLVVLLLENLSRRWGNDLSDSLLKSLKDSLDKQSGSPTNLYSEIRERK